MSDFVSRLAARAVGEEPRARPPVAPAAEVAVWEDDMEARGGEDLVGGAQGGGVEVVVECVGPKEDGGQGGRAPGRGLRFQRT